MSTEECPGKIVTDTNGNEYCYVIPYPLATEEEFPGDLVDHEGDFIPWDACISWGGGFWTTFGDAIPCGPAVTTTVPAITGAATVTVTAQRSERFDQDVVAEVSQPVTTLPATGVDAGASIIGGLLMAAGVILVGVSRIRHGRL